ncbi:MAG: sigma-54-dependent Fis family transcriptional regulator [Phaeodactylibacter sp.]|nr:sigma-54-dependent Fis family transcriptional regulator [Phaeodactylibacter sp.]
MKPKDVHILVIDDDEAVCISLKLLLKRAGYSTASINRPQDIERAMSNARANLILLDMNFTIDTSGKQGLRAMQQLNEQYPDVPVVLMTAWATVQLAVQGMKLGARDFIAKPWDNKALLKTIKTLLDLQAPANEEVPSNVGFEHIVGEDSAFLETLAVAKRISPTDASVLILGESGTGKEVLAEAIHYQSERNAAPFVRVNLGGISSTLFESELFGHKKGAFTDAITEREGRFAKANGGSIFLDEIGDLPLPNQVKLLRVLQEKTFEPLGSSDTVKVDCRVISATNKNLEEMVREGSFREDLFYRINLIKLTLPPLRERPGDIPLLGDHFLNTFKRNYQRSDLRLSTGAKKWLRQQSFPGNIRALRNLIERAVLVVSTEVLEAADLQGLYHPATGTQQGGLNLPEVGKVSLEEMEIEMIRRTLRHHDGNITLVAQDLGLTRSAVYRRMQKYGIPYAT